MSLRRHTSENRATAHGNDEPDDDAAAASSPSQQNINGSHVHPPVFLGGGNQGGWGIEKVLVHSLNELSDTVGSVYGVYGRKRRSRLGWAFQVGVLLWHL